MLMQQLRLSQEIPHELPDLENLDIPELLHGGLRTEESAEIPAMFFPRWRRLHEDCELIVTDQVRHHWKLWASAIGGVAFIDEVGDDLGGADEDHVLAQEVQVYDGA